MLSLSSYRSFQTSKNLLSSKDGRCSRTQMQGPGGGLCARKLQCQFADFSQIQLAGAEVGNRFNFEECLRTRHPQVGEARLIQAVQTVLQLLFVQSMEHKQALSLFF